MKYSQGKFEPSEGEENFVGLHRVVSGETQEEQAQSLNVAMANGDFSMKLCKTCGTWFPMFASEARWYSAMEFLPPKRCASCRLKSRVK